MNEEGRSLYIRLLQYVKPYWRTFLVAIVAMVVLAATEPAIPAILQQVIGGFERKDLGAIPLFALLFIGVFFIRGLSTFVHAVCLAWVGGKLVMDLREQMFDKVISLPASYLNERPGGSLISKITYDAAQVAEAGTQVLTVLVRDTLTIIGLFAWMLYLNWQLTLVAVVTGPVVVYIVKYFSRRLRRMSVNLQHTMGDVTHVVDEALQGYKVVRGFGAQDYERRRLRDTINWARRYQMKFSAAQAANAPIAQFVTSLALAAILYIAAQQFEAGEMTIASFVSFFSAMAMLFSPLKRLTNINGRLQKGLAAADSAFDLMDQPSEPDLGTRDIGRCRGRIEFRNVSFSYKGGEDRALHAASFLVEPGETLALAGPSGSGKTTVANLIPRFYEPDAGTILLDDVDVRDLSLAALRKNIAFVNQEVVLFNDTVAANIAYGRDDPSNRNRVIEAARAAHAMEFIEELPQGLDTEVGERGVRLSGGQRQRLAIARAFYKDAPILILDEATSSLDSASERHIQAALEDLGKGRTTIVIAHRLSSIERAERIAVMTGGHIVDIGTHSELLEANSLYAGLYRFQFARRQEDTPAAGVQ